MGENPSPLGEDFSLNSAGAIFLGCSTIEKPLILFMI